ncbi:glutamine-hydrolyzing GMP synthase [Dolosicoccus paucivorans]|uniref:glutamine-hydrolyzing GMP synthase n=1 Tax=Dolosicoccus paucivorans TaxID=84521 RepID=UPI000890D169|nr:glutamine-hydrolyzing GMP synthase [Dolosicoccus paucivorans]SDI37568.1 GMP synthase (glutamine-hydrolyzing) [Dolosicoccus paucivorans]
MIDSIEAMEQIVIIDLGSSHNQALTRKIREMDVFSQVVPFTATAEDIQKLGDVKGIIIAGESGMINDTDQFELDPAIFDLAVPILGIGTGMQYLTKFYGGELGLMPKVNNELETIQVVDNEQGLFKAIPQADVVMLSHARETVAVPHGAVVSATSEHLPIVAFEDTVKHRYGIHFHPAADETVHGNDILHSFLYGICSATGNWNMENFINIEIAKIRETVGDKKVLLALSGGVDSSVVGVLLQRAIGDQLTCIFVDHGLLRKNEGDEVMEALGQFGLNIRRVNAKDRFFKELKGETDPEEKRKIIGREFIEVFDDQVEKVGHIDFLAQGTIYSDIIESLSMTGQVIKSHHNVGGLPEDMTFELIEPVSLLFKDEVRQLGLALGMPESIVWRQPFPGPGLGVRVLGEITDEKVELVREADAIFREEIANAGLDRDIWQYFAVLPNIQSVGQKHGRRTYDHTIALRAVHSVDAITSDYARIPWDVLDKVSARIVNEVDGVNRVVYDMTPKPPATIEWE